MDKNEILSLIKLIDDPDDEIYAIVKNKILEQPEVFKDYLEDYLIFSQDENAKHRAKTLLEKITYNDAINQLRYYLNTPNHTLIEGVLLLEPFFNKSVDTNKIRLEFENLMKKLWLKAKNKSPLDNLIVFCQTIFEEGYDVNAKTKDELDNNNDPSSLEYLFSTKKMEVNTSMLLLLLIAERFKIPLATLFLNQYLPGFLAYYDDEKNIKYDSYDNINCLVFPNSKTKTLGLIPSQYHHIFDSIKKEKDKSVGIKSNDQFLLSYFRVRNLMSFSLEKRGKYLGINTDDLDKMEIIFERLLTNQL